MTSTSSTLVSNNADPQSSSPSPSPLSPPSPSPSSSPVLLVCLIGLPSTGKSTLCQWIQRGFHCYWNQKSHGKENPNDKMKITFYHLEFDKIFRSIWEKNQKREENNNITILSPDLSLAAAASQTSASLSSISSSPFPPSHSRDGDASSSLFRNSSQQMYSQCEEIIKTIKCKPSYSSDSLAHNNNNINLTELNIILLDDLNHLRSMRRKYFSLCRKYQIPFSSIAVTTEGKYIEDIIQINMKREEERKWKNENTNKNNNIFHFPVTEETIRKIFRTIEIPPTPKQIQQMKMKRGDIDVVDRNCFFIHTDLVKNINISSSSPLSELFDFLIKSFDNQFIPPEIQQSPNPSSSSLSSLSFFHHLDISLRHSLQFHCEKLKSKAENSSFILSKPLGEIFSHWNQKRRELLERCKKEAKKKKEENDNNNEILFSVDVKGQYFNSIMEEFQSICESEINEVDIQSKID